MTINGGLQASETNDFDSDVEFNDYDHFKECHNQVLGGGDGDGDGDGNDYCFKVNESYHARVEDEWASWEKLQYLAEMTSFNEEEVSREIEVIVPEKPSLERQQEYDNAFIDFLNICKEEDIVEMQNSEEFFCLCMDELWTIDRDLFDAISKGKITKDWYEHYTEAMKKESKRKLIEEEKRKTQLAKEKEKQALIKKGVCFCNPNANRCSCKAFINKKNKYKRTMKFIAKKKRGKLLREQKLEARRKKMQLAKRELFLAKKAADEKRWKESFVYQDALRRAKEREMCENVIQQQSDSDSELENLENDSSLEEGERLRCIEKHNLFKQQERDASFENFMAEIVKNEEKEKVKTTEIQKKAMDDKSWNISVRRKKNPVEKKKKPQVISLEDFEFNRHVELPKHLAKKKITKISSPECVNP